MLENSIIDDWINAQMQAILHSKTFNAPTLNDLESIKVNDSVKICNGRERFWVTVKLIEADNIIGKIDNHLTNTSKYNYGDYVKFKSYHIYNILGRNNDGNE
ncbi:hypothetical protein AQUSIP_12680 [Aquicella siphonis]|uniref:DUF2314 domain-containing protein n=1 Tax=Aquicella siphonis TaxID=254247 RepID=A0A5E4PHN9_9COXI|nr:hypothetical protein [Aquicella siphonis]VVC75967.1 hypothetical protein AQUSIP_12680 [Aquicella siphonis]